MANKRGPFAFVTLCAQDVGPANVGVGQQLLRRRRLSSAGLAGEQQNLSPPGERIRQSPPATSAAPRNGPRTRPRPGDQRPGRTVILRSEIPLRRQNRRQHPTDFFCTRRTILWSFRQHPEDQRIEPWRKTGNVPGRSRPAARADVGTRSLPACRRQTAAVPPPARRA